MSDYSSRIQKLKKDILEFQSKYGFENFEIMETEIYRLQLNLTLYIGKLSLAESELGVKFPEEYSAFLLEICDGMKGKWFSLLPLQVAMDATHWDIRADFTCVEPWNPEYQGLMSDDSPETLGAEEYEHRQKWLLWWGDSNQMKGTLCVQDMGDGYYRHLVINGGQRRYLWEDLRAVDEDIIPTTLHQKTVDFLNYYEHEIRYNLRGLENELQ